MSEGNLPTWVGEVADVLSIISVPVTFWLGYQARKVKDYFFNRVRIAEIVPELKQEAEKLFASLGNWGGDQGKSTVFSISRMKGLLSNLKRKVEADELKSVLRLLAKIDSRRYYFIKRKISNISESEAWEIAAEYEAVIIQIQSAQKDSNWRQ